MQERRMEQCTQGEEANAASGEQKAGKGTGKGKSKTGRTTRQSILHRDGARDGARDVSVTAMGTPTVRHGDASHRTSPVPEIADRKHG